MEQITKTDGIGIEQQAQPWTTSAVSDKNSSFFHAVSVVRRIVAERHDRPSLVSRIACEIGAEIIENLRLPGEVLSSAELARRYGRSRTPIREALMLLEKEGLVDVPPRRRPRVAAFDLGEVREIYNVRAALLGTAAASVAENATPADLAMLRMLLANMQEAYERGDLDAYLWANVEFHNGFTIAAHNRTAKRIIESLLLRTLRLRRLSLSLPSRLAKSYANHAQLVEACADRDGSLAAALVRSNHLQALAALEAHLKTDDGTRRGLRAKRPTDAAAS